MSRPRNAYFAVFLLSISLFSAFLVSCSRRKTMLTEPSNSARNITAILTGSLTLPLSPENISTIPLYQIHANLWDTILARDGKAGLATLTETRDSGKVLSFEITPDSRFSNGRPIHSSDVVFSIQRLMTRQEGGHFNARGVIAEIKAVTDTRFEIRLKDTTPAFLFLLSIPEMGIVPSEACDHDGNVSSLAVTSGAYVAVGKPSEGQIALTKNTYFKRNDSKSPDRVTVLFSPTGITPADALRSRQADFLEVYDGAGIAAFESLKTDPKIDRRITRPSYSIFMVLKSDRLSESERLSISKLMREEFPSHYTLNSELEKWSREILPPGTFGSLGNDLPPLPNPASGSLPKHLRIGLVGTPSPLAKAVISILSAHGVKVEFVASDSTEADVGLSGHGMNYDFPEIEFYLAMISPWASIIATEKERSLITQSLHSGDPEVRTRAIREIGRGLIATGRVIPLIVRSYVHVFRKDRINLDAMTNYDGDVVFSRMRVEP